MRVVKCVRRTFAAALLHEEGINYDATGSAGDSVALRLALLEGLKEGL